MKVSIIGNGFDIRHNLKTKFSDFIEYYIGNVRKDNIVVMYFQKVDIANGWLDFESELQKFLIYLSKMNESVRIANFMSKPYIDPTVFINTYETYLYYSTIREKEYDFFEIMKNSSAGKYMPLNSLMINNEDWLKKLSFEVNKDIECIQNSLKEYLNIIQEKSRNKVERISTSEIDIIKTSDKVITFNYTNTLDLYLESGISYAHGNLDGEIVLGIPYTPEITIKDFNKLFKTSQTLQHNYNIPLDNKKIRKIELYFIGFSFGVSDHYFFQEVIDLINIQEKNFGVLANVSFNIYYHSEKSIPDYINNFREFLGDKNLSRFSKQNRIKFFEYEDVENL